MNTSQTERKQSETERAINEAYAIFKSSLESILKVTNLNVCVDVTGVKLSTLAIIVEEGEELEISIINNSVLPMRFL